MSWQKRNTDQASAKRTSDSLDSSLVNSSKEETFTSVQLNGWEEAGVCDGERSCMGGRQAWPQRHDGRPVSWLKASTALLLFILLSSHRGKSYRKKHVQWELTKIPEALGSLKSPLPSRTDTRRENLAVLFTESNTFPSSGSQT